MSIFPSYKDENINLHKNVSYGLKFTLLLQRCAFKFRAERLQTALVEEANQMTSILLEQMKHSSTYWPHSVSRIMTVLHHVNWSIRETYLWLYGDMLIYTINSEN